MQAISNSKQNFTGTALMQGAFSQQASYNIEKALPKLRDIIYRKPFNLIIQEYRFCGDVLKISAQKTEDYLAQNKKKVTAYVTNKAKNPSELYVEAAKHVIRDYNKQYIKPGNFFDRMLDKLTKYFK